MAISTQSLHLVYGGTATTPTWAKITANGKDLCIKDFPDLNNADKDQIETTTLCDTAHTFIDGLDNLPDELEFTANFDNDLYDEIETKTAEAWWGLQLGDASGNPRWYFKATANAELVGGGVGDVLEMRVVLRPKTTIEKENIA